MKLANKILKTSIGYSFLKYFSFFLGLGGQIVLVRYISPEIFTPFIISLAFIEIIYAFGSIGINDVLLKYQEEKDIFGTATYLVCFLSLLLFFISCITSFFFIERDVFFVVLFLSFSKSTAMFSSIFGTYLEKDFKHDIIGLIEVIAKLISISGAIYLASKSFKIEALLFRDLCLTLIINLILFLLVFKKIDYRFNLLSAKKIFEFSYKHFIISFLEVYQKNIPILFLNKYSNTSSVLFEKSYYLVRLPNMFLSPINTKISYSFFTKFRDQKNKIYKAIYLNFYFTLRIIIPLFFIFYFFTEDIVLLVYGNSWIEIVKYLRPLTFLILYFPLISILKFYLYSDGKLNFLLITRLFSLIFIVISLVFLKTFNFSDVYISWAYSTIMFIFFLFLFFKSNLILKLDLKTLFLNPLCIVMLCCPVLIFLKINWYLNSIIFLLLYITLLLIMEKKHTIILLQLFKK